MIVAVSGGADSVGLLLALADLTKRKKLNLRIVAAHFNHKLRGAESDEDEKFVEKLATGLGFEFVSASGKIAGRSNLEQRARNARYEFLATAAEKLGSRYVLTAHTINDQAETLLLNLIRGSGASGLGGMPVTRVLRNDESQISNLKSEISDALPRTRLVRPLLRGARREDTVGFCRENGIEFRLDAMNEDVVYTRVRIRKTVLPMLAEMNPKIVETLARTAELLAEPPSSAGGVIVADPKDSPQGATLKLSELKALKKEALYTVLRGWLRRNRGNSRGLTLKHIQAVERLIHSRKSGRTVELPGRQTVAKQGGRLTWRQIKVEK